MIKPNELRVGNLFHPTMYSNGIRVPQSTIAKIITIDAFHVLWLPSDLNPAQVKWNESKYNEIEPIPLTSEWLLKFGFEKTTGLTWSLSHEKTYSVYRKSGLAYNEIKVEWWYGGILLKKQPDSVHELQNLYYALTGEELTIQEKEIDPPMMGMSY